MRFGTPVHTLVLPMFRVSLVSSVKVLGKQDHRHGQRYVSQVIPESVKLTMKMNQTIAEAGAGAVDGNYQEEIARMGNGL